MHETYVFQRQSLLPLVSHEEAALTNRSPMSRQNEIQPTRLRPLPIHTVALGFEFGCQRVVEDSF